jgi:hypothetical protein
LLQKFLSFAHSRKPDINLSHIFGLHRPLKQWVHCHPEANCMTLFARSPGRTMYYARLQCMSMWVNPSRATI